MSNLPPDRLRKRPDRFGITLIELIVVMSIITILVSLSVPALSEARKAARKTQCQNHLRNVALGLLWFEDTEGRFPASGYYFDPSTGKGGAHHSWAVSILPYLDQGNLYDSWDLDKPIDDPANLPLTRSHIPVFICPMDISRSEEKKGDLSYAVNGGWGFTIRTGNGVGDCPINWHGQRLDLNGDGKTCVGDDAIDDKDRDIYKELGVFFLENWKAGGTERHHSIDQVIDGATQTYLLGENVRTGFDPDSSIANFADPNPYRSAFYVGTPCVGGSCVSGAVDYQLSNSGSNQINSGLWSAEGSSPVPNSFHEGGINMAYCDGRVVFLSENIDGAVHAALASPQGMRLQDTVLQQIVLTGSEN